MSEKNRLYVTRYTVNVLSTKPVKENISDIVYDALSQEQMVSVQTSRAGSVLLNAEETSAQMNRHNVTFDYFSSVNIPLDSRVVSEGAD